jgi:hypothetical protein
MAFRLQFVTWWDGNLSASDAQRLASRRMLAPKDLECFKHSKSRAAAMPFNASTM